MHKTIKLTITDRSALCRYINLITCTIPIRLVIDEFIDKFSPSDEELKKAGVTFNDGRISSIKDDFEKEFSTEDVPVCIRNGILEFCEALEANKNAPKDYVESVTQPLKKVL